MESERVRLNVDMSKKRYCLANVIGLEDKVYLSEKQAEALIKANNNPETRSNFVKVGSVMFKPSSITSIQTKEIEFCYLPKYCQERLKAEEYKLIGGKKDE